jgi:hypothetical protein
VTEAVQPSSRGKLWLGRIISAIPVLLMVFSAVMKFAKPPAVVQGFAHFGYPERLMVTIGILEFACAVIYAIPRTSVLGAILIAAYLGGATATNVRVGDPSWVMTVLLGVLAWLGLFLRDDRIRALVPLKS